MLDCQAVLDKLFDYIDAEMSDEARRQLKSHLDLCRNCFDRVEFEQLLRTQLRRKTNHTCPEHLKKRIEIILENF